MEKLASYKIISSRIFDTSVEKIYKAWTDPEHLSKWWGPKGFTNTFEVFELKPGGRWTFIMHGPDGHNYPNDCVFEKIEPLKFLSWNRNSKPLFKVTVDFNSKSSDQTEVIFKMIFDDEHVYKALNSVVPEKNEENFDRLEEELKNIKII